MSPSLRFFSRLGGIALLFVGILLALAVIFRPALPTARHQVAAQTIKETEKLRDTTWDHANPPVIQRDVDYSQGVAGKWYPKEESSILAELVKEGKIPPVAERVGPEPVVLEGVEGTGKYGGTWMRVCLSATDAASVLTPRLSCTTLVRWSPMGYPIRPHLAKGWSASADKKEWTVYLRKGVRWSDGVPFTADDIMYWWEKDRTISLQPPKWMMLGGKLGSLTKIDDYTIKFSFSEPYGSFLTVLANPYTLGILTPKHYLEQYHPETGNKELIAATMKAQGSINARAVYTSMKDIRNPECPRLWPWIYRTVKTSSPEGYVRNPYFWAVDPDGRQLPYVDRILFEVKSAKLIPITAASGDLTMQARYITYDNYTLLMANREMNHYQVYHWFPASRSAWTIWPNTNRAVEDSDPDSARKAPLLADKRFRHALSLAIDRQSIIDSIYNGFGVPSQIEPGPDSEFHSQKLADSFVKHDPDAANAILDRLGLTKRDEDGMRTFPDGARMQWFVDFTTFAGEGPAQFIVEDWAKVGVRAVQRERNGALFATEKAARKQDFTVWTGESEFNPMLEPRSFVPVSTEAHYAPAYGQWYSRDGYNGGPTARPETAPPKDSPAYRLYTLYEQSLRLSDMPDQIRIFKEILDIAAENTWSISIATPPPQLAIVKDGFRNVPKNVIYGYTYATPANAGIETFYFDQPHDTPEAIAQIKTEMTTITPAEFSINPKTLETRRGSWETVFWKIILTAGALGIVATGVRHPYIGRRLIIMLPTLLIVSLTTFFIIQLPPGDYIQTRIQELEVNGDQNAIDDVRRLREVFFLDDPIYMQYLRWMGIRWFFTQQPADRGLLQGELGRSMASSRSVNDMVGDRVLLTVVISLGTILFTWLVAMSIGIYSAVKQYTVGDYVLTFGAFVGMCVPNFLLAILLMFWSGKYLGINITGLFSPEYLATPNWSAGKVIDLLKHVWVPIIVIAAGGTAGLIRVMRGNLLDELRKPYVTTAMAKGVRPFPLLMKYPVRMALNPFMSGIGHIFPHLISGGAIVAIVLSLPLVGPLLIDALMMKDVNMAASMLMVLSLLGVLGTLVSDLMLLWLDPRIRLTGGSK